MIKLCMGENEWEGGEAIVLFGSLWSPGFHWFRLISQEVNSPVLLDIISGQKANLRVRGVIQARKCQKHSQILGIWLVTWLHSDNQSGGPGLLDKQLVGSRQHNP